MMKGSYDQNSHRDSGEAASLLRAAAIGVIMAISWGMISGILHLEELLPGAPSETMFSQPMAVQLILYGMAGPVLEEFLFRYLLFHLTSKVMPDVAACVVVSALFAVWHGNVLQMLYAFPAGLILQTLRMHSHRMEEPIVCHMSANLTAIAVSALLS